MFFLIAGSGQRPTDSSTHSSGGSFHSSRGPLGVHNSWTDSPTGRGVSHYHHQNSELYRENIPAAELQLLHSQGIKAPSLKPTVEKEKKTLRDIMPPLSTSRLKPIRQKTKNAVVRQSFHYIYILYIPTKF